MKLETLERAVYNTSQLGLDVANKSLDVSCGRAAGNDDSLTWQTFAEAHPVPCPFRGDLNDMAAAIRASVTADMSYADAEAYRVVGFDLETTMRGPDKSPAWHHKDNEILQGCSIALPYDRELCGGVVVVWDTDQLGQQFSTEVIKHHLSLGRLNRKAILVGHNIAFDVLWTLRSMTPAQAVEFLTALRSGKVRLFDTQLAQYLLKGQRVKFPTLEETGKQWCGRGKEDILSEYITKGLTSEDVPRNELAFYMLNDVMLTLGVAYEQVQGLTDEFKMLLTVQNRALAAYIEMMWNGLPFDIVANNNYLRTLAYDRGTIAGDLVEAWLGLRDWFGVKAWLEADDISCDDVVNSPTKLAKMFTGGSYKVKDREAVGTYKNGNPKYKVVTKEVSFPGIGDTFTKNLVAQKGAGESVLNELAQYLDATYPRTSEDITSFLRNVVKYRELNKLIGTYHEAFPALVSDVTGNINHTINNTSTGTGRTSSTHPNGQNIPPTDIKKCFTKPGYTCIEFDFKQLEVIALAIRTQDVQLIDDLVNGRDLHFETGKLVYGWKTPADMEERTRRIIKTINFGLIYGGGANALAEQAKCDVAIAKACIAAFYARYPGVKAYYDSHYNSLTARLACMGAGNRESGKPKYSSYEVTATGRWYRYDTYDPKYAYQDKDKGTLSPTEVKNWETQGLATGDIVPLGIAYAHNVCAKYDPIEVQFNNTVHDSLVMWVKDELVKDVVLDVQSTLEAMLDVAKVLWPALKIPKGLPLKVDVKAGPSWGETSKFTLTS